MEGIIHGGAYFRNFTVFYFRLFYFILFFQIYFNLYTSTIYIVTTTLNECLQMTRLWLGSYKKLKPFLRTFQGPPTRNVMLLTAKMHIPSPFQQDFEHWTLCSNKLFYIFQFTCLKLIVNYCIEQKTLHVKHL